MALRDQRGRERDKLHLERDKPEAIRDKLAADKTNFIGFNGELEINGSTQPIRQ